MPIPVQPPRKGRQAKPNTALELVYQQIGPRLTEARLRRNITQQALADYTGILRTSISLFETCAQRIQVHDLMLIAEALDVSPCWLLTGED